MAELITKQRVIDNFHNQVRNVVAGSIQWHSGNVPSLPSGGNVSSYMGSNSLPSLSANSLSGVCTAQQVINACNAIAYEYTRVRQFRWEQHWTGERTGLASSGQAMSALNNNYRQGFSANYDITSNTHVKIPRMTD